MIRPSTFLIYAPVLRIFCNITFLFTFLQVILQRSFPVFAGRAQSSRLSAAASRPPAAGAEAANGPPAAGAETASHPSAAGAQAASGPSAAGADASSRPSQLLALMQPVDPSAAGTDAAGPAGDNAENDGNLKVPSGQIGSA
jgi:hypothetical protein